MELCENSIFPVLKNSDFKRRGLHFYRYVNDVVQTLNIQKSQWNSYNDSLRFTINVGLYNDELSFTYTEKPKSFPKVSDSFIQTRLGHLVYKKDEWYEITLNSVKAVAKQLEQDLTIALLPFFESNKSLLSISSLIEMDNNFVLSSYNHILLLVKVDKKNRAETMLQEEYKKALNPKGSTHTVDFPDGTQKVSIIDPQINKVYIERLEKLAQNHSLHI